MLWETFSLLLKTMLNKSNMLLKLWLQQQVSSEKVRICKCIMTFCLGFLYRKTISKKAGYKHSTSLFLIKYQNVTLIYTYVHCRIFHMGWTWMGFTELRGGEYPIPSLGNKWEKATYSQWTRKYPSSQVLNTLLMGKKPEGNKIHSRSLHQT